MVNGRFCRLADGISVNAICAEASVYQSMSAEVVYGYCRLAGAVVRIRSFLDIQRSVQLVAD